MPRGRPEGSKNKTPFKMILLSELVAFLQPNAKVPVKKEFADAVMMSDEVGDDVSVVSEMEEPISVTRHSRSD